MKKGTKLYSILKMKCPNCHEGDFFDGSIYKATVKNSCEKCGFKYSIEPGFYQGSYYVVYALGVAVFVTIWTSLTLFLPSVAWDTSLILIILGLIVAAPFIYPLSKIIWANLFFRYGRYKSKKQNGHRSED